MPLLDPRSWYEIDLSSSPLDVDNIVTSPNFTSTRFVLYGTRGTAGVRGEAGSLECAGVRAVVKKAKRSLRAVPSYGP